MDCGCPVGMPTERKLVALALPPVLATELAPLRELWAPLGEQLALANDRLAAVAAPDPRVRQLLTAPGIGPVTAVAFVATLDDVALITATYRVRVFTSASRTASSARTCRCPSEARCAGRYAPSRAASANVLASRRSVFTPRRRVAYIGA